MIVVKIGGDIFQKGLTENLLLDIKKLLQNNKLIIIHGGGDEVTDIAEKLGKKQIFITSPEGIKSRYTDIETVEIFTMVMAGRINKAIVKWLLKESILAIGLSGIDGTLLKANRKKRLLIIDDRGRRRIIDGGYTGKLSQVNIFLLNLLLENGYVPVIAPIAIGSENEYLNIDADRVAAQIAGSLHADSVIFLTDVKGLLLDGKHIKKIGINEAERLLSKIGPGMNKKVLASIEALKIGAKEALISSGFINKPITKALKHSCGTVIELG